MAKETRVTAYKAFNKDWACRGFQYEVGRTYEMTGPVVVCQSGFHACTIPADVWAYYDITESRIARVTVVDPVAHEGDSKVASAKITIEAEISLPEWIGATVKAITDLCGKPKKKGELVGAASGNSSKLAASGDYSKLAASGDYSKLAASGDYSKLAASGYSSTLAASGYYSTLAASGYGSRAKAGANGAIALAYHDGKRPRFAVGYVGEDGIRADTWYHVEDGKLTEVK